MISFETFSSGFPSALLVSFLSLEAFNFLLTQQAAFGSILYFFPLSVLDKPFIFFVFFPKTNLKPFSSKRQNFKTLNCILFQTILDWCVLLCHITLGNSVSLSCISQQASESDGLNWTRSIKMQCDAYSIGFFEALQQILPMNTNMKAFRSCLKNRLDTNKSKYKIFKDKIPGMWPNPWKCLCNWFPLGIFGMDAKCVCLSFLFVSFYEC